MVKFLLIFSLAIFAYFGYSETVVYYDPDGNLRRIMDINNEGNKFFSKFNINFVATADSRSFDIAVNSFKPEFMIINSLIFQNTRNKMGLEPLFVFTKEGKITYKKKLVSFEKEFPFSLLKGSVISSPFQDLEVFLGPSAKGVRVLKVPKDMDAILALKFKQSEAALVSDDTIEVFKVISPSDFNNLNIVFTSKDILNPLFVKTSFAKKDYTALIDKLYTSFSSQGKSFLAIMLFDGVSKKVKVE